jgi:glutamyl-tRNA reductase
VAAVVIAAADTRGTVLTRSRLRARLATGPLTVVDLAVPRSVGADARALPGLRYVDVDGLSDIAGAELDPAALVAIEARCEGAAAAVLRELDERRAGPTIRALRERADEIRRRQLDRALARLAHLSARDRRVVESLSEGLTHALLHEPTVRLREAPEREPAARDLFAL